MSVTRTVRPESARASIVSTGIPPVPLTIEGYSVLHQMMRFRWSAWRALRPAQKAKIIHEASGVLAKMEQNASGQSGLYSLLGHKGDLMIVHFRQSFEELNQAELQIARLRLSDYLEPMTSYLSVIELGLYESTIKVYSELAERGVEAHSEEWNRVIKETLVTAERSYAAAIVSGAAQAPVSLFLPDGSAARRRQELVHGSHRRAGAADE